MEGKIWICDKTLRINQRTIASWHWIWQWVFEYSNGIHSERKSRQIRNHGNTVFYASEDIAIEVKKKQYVDWKNIFQVSDKVLIHKRYGEILRLKTQQTNQSTETY